MNTPDELKAMQDLYNILQPMERNERARVIEWVTVRLREEDKKAERLGIAGHFAEHLDNAVST